MVGFNHSMNYQLEESDFETLKIFTASWVDYVGFLGRMASTPTTKNPQVPNESPFKKSQIHKVCVNCGDNATLKERPNRLLGK